jgi:dTDP-4-amino-4,6-dideoxygalactose transaminase
MIKIKVPFNKPYMTGKELTYIAQAHANKILAGDGPFTKFCNSWLEKNNNVAKALLTHSCTGALEMAALLLNINSGDEVIMPSYTFVSTANAFVLRGGVPVFIDIRSDTLNINESLIESKITKKTKAIVPVHYAGVSCEMDTIISIAKENKIAVIEDAAQGIMSTYKGKALGSFGEFGALSFHETKNIISGEGGALLINNSIYEERSEIIREKGTNRSQFHRGLIDKYTWKDLGSSYLPSEIMAAFLAAQLEMAEEITESRLKLWNRYNILFKTLECMELIKRPTIPKNCVHNGHMYYVLLADHINREKVLQYMHLRDINAVFHYVPLHNSPAGKKYTQKSSNLTVTENISERLVRLPMWIGLSEKEQDYIVQIMYDAILN